MNYEIPTRYIEKAVSKYEAWINSKKKDNKAEQRGNLVITVSRETGSGGRKVAEALGKALDLHIWDKQILDVLASQSNMNYQSRMFEALDEKAQNAIDALVSNFFGDIDKHTYLKLLPKAVYVISHHDSIILGRGAHLLLPQSFRVRIGASIETRIQNIVSKESIDEKAAKEKIKEIDRQRLSYIKELKRYLHIKDTQFEYDLCINTDRLSIEQSVDIILHGIKAWRVAI